MVKTTDTSGSLTLVYSQNEYVEVLQNQSRDEVGKDLGIEMAVLEGWRLLGEMERG